MKQQVEDRLEFYETGVNPAKNLDVMREAMSQVNTSQNLFERLALRVHIRLGNGGKKVGNFLSSFFATFTKLKIYYS